MRGEARGYGEEERGARGLAAGVDGRARRGRMDGGDERGRARPHRLDQRRRGRDGSGWRRWRAPLLTRPTGVPVP